MTQLEIEMMTAAIGPVIREYVAKSTAEMTERLQTMQRAVADLTTQLTTIQLREGPPGKDGANGRDGRDGVDGQAGMAGADGRAGVDGVPGADGRAGADGAAGLDGKDGAPGRDGVAGKDGLNGKDGEPGPPGVAGKDGEPGRDGLPGLNGRDGKDGAPGQDGLGFDDLKSIETETHYGLVASRGDVKREYLFTKPTVPRPTMADFYRGVWTERGYVRGDCVTHQGSLWLAHKDTTAKPGLSQEWQLIVKRGNHGRDGERGQDGKPGAEGKPGRDLTQVGPDGQQLHRW